jgi:hypothetical protein
VESALEAAPNGSVREIAEISGYEPSTVFFILTQVLLLEFSHWRWVPHSLSDDRKMTPVEGAELLQVQRLAAKRRNRSMLWTGAGSWIVWDNQRSGSWLQINQELPVRFKQTS